MAEIKTTNLRAFHADRADLRRFFLMLLKRQKSCLLAPIAVKILMTRGSGHKIVTESGTHLPEKAQSFCSQKLAFSTFKTP